MGWLAPCITKAELPVSGHAPLNAHIVARNIAGCHVTMVRCPGLWTIREQTPGGM